MKIIIIFLVLIISFKISLFKAEVDSDPIEINVVHVSGVLLGYSLSDKGLTLRVNDPCVTKDSFEFSMDTSFPPQLNITQKPMKTLCTIYAPYGAEVTFKYKELGGLKKGDKISIIVHNESPYTIIQ